ncbi:hypothetical protein PQX77_006437 [Marasmius sp. AFHP31]|nr:hypothetical protein PQX77_006437 [Marasmius sp. AFHP31]
MATATAASSDSASDWGQPEPSTSQQHAAKKSNTVVRDDWEDEEEEEESPSDERNKEIWEEAYVSHSIKLPFAIPDKSFMLRNTKVPAPMPVLSPSSSSRSATSPPPPAAFQPAFKILKRPSNATTPAGNRTPSPASLESLKEREARYQEARNRIFNEGDSETKRPTPTPTPTPTGIARNPHGPTVTASSDTHTNEGQAGFGKRRTQAPPKAPASK